MCGKSQIRTVRLNVKDACRPHSGNRFYFPGKLGLPIFNYFGYLKQLFSVLTDTRGYVGTIRC